MTRGKYGARAARRREEESVRSEMDSYQHTIRRLTAENQELRKALSRERKIRHEETRALRAERDEGVSPELSVLQRETDRLREERDRAVRERTETLKKWHIVADRLHGFLSNKLGGRGVDGMDAMMELLDPGDGSRPSGTTAGIGTMFEPKRQRFSVEMVEQLDRARGFKKSKRIDPGETTP